MAEQQKKDEPAASSEAHQALFEAIEAGNLPYLRATLTCQAHYDTRVFPCSHFSLRMCLASF
jgi:hypothetical protein